MSNDVGLALAKELRELGSEADFVSADVRHEEDVSALVDKTVERFGRLDVAVNNAGAEGKPRPMTEQSPGVPAKRLGTPEDIAQAIVFLASDKADFITGQVIGVNGGKTAL